MSPDDLFAGGGASGRLMAGLDWAGTDLGPVAGWPQSLRAAVRIVLSSRYPMLLLWGPRFTQLYNDAYSALIGDQHPAALGGDVRVTLADSWPVLEPLIRDAMATGVASWVPALQLLLDRSGYREEAYFSVSHAPARDDDGSTRGVLTVCSEVTDQIVGERRLRLLRDLALPAGTETVAETCARLCDVLGAHPLDVPFAAIYLREGGRLRLAAGVGADTGGQPVEAALPDSVEVLTAYEDDVWGLREAAAGGTGRTDDVVKRVAVAGGPWDDPVRTAMAQPLPSGESGRPVGVVLTGISPSRGLDEAHRSFLQLLAQQVAVAVRNAQAYQHERERAEALAELDRVKSGFFTNVSHEFRTPLTLMLGPLADALADRREPLGADQRDRVDTAWRNANRLLGLVNDLLTFSSLEAGRAGHAPRPVDLAKLTTELAGVFRSAVERAGLRLVVDCPALPRPVAVDPGSWEKIVTNLISNALKFTFVGEIRVALTADDDQVRLTVADTGIGIDEGQLPRLFDRFHRVQGVRSRSHEGTGIGLAMVRELSRLQGGDVQVASAPGEGTTFTVRLPWSAVDLGPDPEAPGAAGFRTAEAAAREVDGWLDDPAAGSGAGDGPVTARILVADDNSDMRAYLARLLGAEGWQVETAPDGQAALEVIARRPPDLLVTDVMMPRLDGFGLVRALRRDPATTSLPIVMLSARAGQEAGVDGLQAGADDYVVKPFTAAELIARVRSALRPATRPGVPARTPADPAAVIASGRELERTFREAAEQVRLLLGAARAVVEVGELRFSAGAASGETHPVTAGPVRADLPSPPDGLTRDLAAALTPVLDALVRGTGPLEVLPDSPPLPAGWELTARHARSDVSTLPGGDLLISVVTVAGDGPGAELTSALVRTAVGVLATAAPPATIPARLGGLPAAEVLLVRVAPDTGALLWSSAGGTDVHPLRPPAPVAEVTLPDFDATWVFPLAATSAAAVRRQLRTVLDSDQTDPDLLTDLQVAATEAVNNAVEHAQHPTRPEVHVRLLVTGGLVRVEVRDFGSWRERPPARDRGRGATLMNAYGDVRVTTTGTGTLVTIERRWAAG